MKCLVILLGVAGPAWAADRMTTVVRADAHTGRLVRSVVVRPREIPLVEVGTMVNGNRGGDPGGLLRLIEETARRHDVDPLLVKSIVEVESAYNPHAVSRKGAQGLMQLMPMTARRYGVLRVFDVRDNVEGGVKYLRYLKDLFKEDRLAVAAYNAGEQAVIRYGGVPPYPETEQYVVKVARRYGEALRKAKLEEVKPAEGIGAEADESPRSLDVLTDEEGRVFLRTR